ncbi:MAG: hypothetical protein E7022_00140 [Desulfovibrio desulfuricans]|nr:hypothetical protein [Desulfovibrio desulfuricans]
MGNRERVHRPKAQRAHVAAELARVGQARWDAAQKAWKVPAAGLVVNTLTGRRKGRRAVP